MTLLSQIERLVTTIGQQYDLPDLSLDDDRTASLLIGDDLTLSIVYRDEPHAHAFLCGEVGLLAGSRFEEMALALLEMNGKWSDTGGLSFGLHSERDAVLVLAPLQSWQLEDEMAPMVLSNFIEVCQDWQRKIAVDDPDLGLRLELDDET